MAAISTLFEGKLTEAQLEQGFTQQFRWNWIWKAKAMPNGSFQMRFPNKLRFEELANFDYFTVKGTDVQVNVKEWTQEAEAVGKLNIAWVKVAGIPDEMKGYQALYEVGSNLGPVMEIDMVTFRANNIIRLKVGLMETDVFPLKLVLTTPKGFLYQARFTLEEVIEQGWFREEIMEEVVVETDDKDLGFAEQSTFGKSRSVVSVTPELMQKEEQMKQLQILKDREMAMQLQVEEDNSSGMKRKLIMDVEGSDKDAGQLGEGVEDKLLKIQEQVIQDQLMGGKKVAVEVSKNVKEMSEEDKEKVNLGDSEDFLDSQESVDSFARQVGVLITEEDTESQEEEKRRSKRLKDKEDRNLQEVAIERK